MIANEWGRHTARSRVSAGSGLWLAPLAGPWIDAARRGLRQHDILVRVTVIALRGSAPREPGATMLVDPVATVGTIGGGRLEWHAIAAARDLIASPTPVSVLTQSLVLGPELGQCCGGRVELWLERLTRADRAWLDDAARRLRVHPGLALATRFDSGRASRRVLTALPGPARVQLRSHSGSVELVEALGTDRPPLWIFGAGHVGQAVVCLLADLALFDITWLDTRPDLLPGGLPECVTLAPCARPADRIAAAAAATHYLVMTHDHALDYEVCRTVLQRGDAAWLGLIGSSSKGARFRSRLQRDGLTAEQLDHLTCPVGIRGVHSKLPAAIAIAIAAQLLQVAASSGGTVCRAAPTLHADAACSGECATCANPRDGS